MLYWPRSLLRVQNTKDTHKTSSNNKFGGKSIGSDVDTLATFVFPPVEWNHH